MRRRIDPVRSNCSSAPTRFRSTGSRRRIPSSGCVSTHSTPNARWRSIARPTKRGSEGAGRAGDRARRALRQASRPPPPPQRPPRLRSTPMSSPNRARAALGGSAARRRRRRAAPAGSTTTQPPTTTRGTTTAAPLGTANTSGTTTPPVRRWTTRCTRAASPGTATTRFDHDRFDHDPAAGKRRLQRPERRRPRPGTGTAGTTTTAPPGAATSGTTAGGPSVATGSNRPPPPPLPSDMRKGVSGGLRAVPAPGARKLRPAFARAMRKKLPSIAIA